MTRACRAKVNSFHRSIHRRMLFRSRKMRICCRRGWSEWVRPSLKRKGDNFVWQNKIIDSLTALTSVPISLQNPWTDLIVVDNYVISVVISLLTDANIEQIQLNFQQVFRSSRPICRVSPARGNRFGLSDVVSRPQASRSNFRWSAEIKGVPQSHQGDVILLRFWVVTFMRNKSLDWLIIPKWLDVYGS